MEVALLLAKISVDSKSGERRGFARRSLSIGTSATSKQTESRVVILNLSETGVRFQTAMLIKVGETIWIELPGSQPYEACIIWSEGDVYGCEFSSPISKATVSAVLLIAPGRSDKTIAEYELENYDNPIEHRCYCTPVSQIITVSILLTLLIVIILFIYALLEVPFSNHHGALALFQTN